MSQQKKTKKRKINKEKQIDVVSVKVQEKIEDAKNSKIVPKIFMKKDEKIHVEVVGFHHIETGELLFVQPKEYFEEENFDNVFIKKDYDFVFTRISYDKLNRYKTRSMIYNTQDKNNTINMLKLREYFLIYHLVDWNLCDEEENKIELKFDPNGSLSDDSIEMFNLLPPIMLDLVFAIFEKKMNIE